MIVAARWCPIKVLSLHFANVSPSFCACLYETNPHLTSPPLVSQAHGCMMMALPRGHQFQQRMARFVVSLYSYGVYRLIPLTIYWLRWKIVDADDDEGEFDPLPDDDEDAVGREPRSAESSSHPANIAAGIQKKPAGLLKLRSSMPKWLKTNFYGKFLITVTVLLGFRLDFRVWP